MGPPSRLKGRVKRIGKYVEELGLFCVLQQDNECGENTRRRDGDGGDWIPMERRGEVDRT